MFLEAFKSTIFSIGQIFILGAIGFFLLKRNILGEAGLDAVSRLVIEVTLPLLIFCQLIRDFSFSLYSNWWLLPLLSLAIMLAGILIGLMFLWSVKDRHQKIQFLSLIAFQNSGYLPLVLVATLLPKEEANAMFIYLFLFLLGFNLLVWSLGVYALTLRQTKKIELASFFSPPVIAALLGLAAVFFGINRTIPSVFTKPLLMIGECTLPLAMFVVGGNLAQMPRGKIVWLPILTMALAKLIFMPALGLFLIFKFKLFGLIGLLMLIQLAMPPATSLSVILRHYKKEDLLIGQGVFWGHILSIITLPVFLSLYFVLGSAHG